MDWRPVTIGRGGVAKVVFWKWGHRHGCNAVLPAMLLVGSGWFCLIAPHTLCQDFPDSIFAECFGPQSPSDYSQQYGNWFCFQQWLENIGDECRGSVVAGDGRDAAFAGGLFPGVGLYFA